MEKLKVNLTLELYSDDLKDVLNKCMKDGLNLETLLQGFIGDLVASQHTRNGSDEVDKANDYYDRCWYGMFPEDTFLRHLLYYGEADSFLDTVADYEYYKEAVESGDKDYTDDLTDSQEQLDDFWTAYTDTLKEIPTNREEAFKTAITALRDRNKFINSCKRMTQDNTI